MVYEQYYPFAELKLEYEDNALEPNIGRYTVFFHYNEHYLPVLKKLNAMVLEQPQAQNISLENLAHGCRFRTRAVFQVVVAESEITVRPFKNDLKQAVRQCGEISQSNKRNRRKGLWLGLYMGLRGLLRRTVYNVNAEPHPARG